MNFSVVFFNSVINSNLQPCYCFLVSICPYTCISYVHLCIGAEQPLLYIYLYVFIPLFDYWKFFTVLLWVRLKNVMHCTWSNNLATQIVKSCTAPETTRTSNLLKTHHVCLSISFRVVTDEPDENIFWRKWTSEWCFSTQLYSFSLLETNYTLSLRQTNSFLLFSNLPLTCLHR